MFGFNNISIDKKSRFSFPAKYRDAFVNSNENQIVITKDPQYPALKVYFGSEWDQISNKLSSLQGLDPIVRNLQWTILGNASVCDFEPNGRMQVLISADLKKYAQIEEANRICLIEKFLSLKFSFANLIASISLSKAKRVPSFVIESNIFLE